MRFLFHNGQARQEIPKSVTHIAFVDTSITEIQEEMFMDCRYLKEVELHGGIKIIGKKAFDNCWKLKTINIPSTVTEIRESAFGSCWKMPLQDLPDGIQVIDEKAFSICVSIMNARIPPSFDRIKKIFSNCQRMISFEMTEKTHTIDTGAFVACWRLRNIAIPPLANVGKEPFNECKDLIQIFPDQNDLIHELKHRFDDRPIHEMCYYQSFHPSGTVVKKVTHENVTQHERQDCLGMTPLHIATLSTRPNLELLKLLIEQYPDDLVTQDKWGELPINYACWVDASAEILRLFLETQTSKFPDHELIWEKILDNLCSCQAPLGKFQLVLETYRNFFLDQTLDWEDLIAYYNTNGAPSGVMGCFIHSQIAPRLNAVGSEAWRMEVLDAIDQIPSGGDWEEDHAFAQGREISLNQVYSALEKAELKETTSQLELGIWKILLDCTKDNGVRGIKFLDSPSNESKTRENCRINSGVEIIIPNVLPFLASAEEDSDEEWQ